MLAADRVVVLDADAERQGRADAERQRRGLDYGSAGAKPRPRSIPLSPSALAKASPFVAAADRRLGLSAKGPRHGVSLRPTRGPTSA